MPANSVQAVPKTGHILIAPAPESQKSSSPASDRPAKFLKPISPASAHSLAKISPSPAASSATPQPSTTTTTTATPSAASSSLPKKFQCPHCPQTFTRHHNLKSHLLIHSQEKKFVCQTCSSKFRRIYDLKRHLKLHTGERPYLCGKCGRRFARGDALIRHTKTTGTCSTAFDPEGGDEYLDDDFDSISDNGEDLVKATQKRDYEEALAEASLSEKASKLDKHKKVKTIDVHDVETNNAANPPVVLVSISPPPPPPAAAQADSIPTAEARRVTFPPPPQSPVSLPSQSTHVKGSSPLVFQQPKLPSIVPDLRRPTPSPVSTVERRQSEASSTSDPSDSPNSSRHSSNAHSLSFISSNFPHHLSINGQYEYREARSQSQHSAPTIASILDQQSEVESPAATSVPSLPSSTTSASSGSSSRNPSASPSLSSIMNPVTSAQPEQIRYNSGRSSSASHKHFSFQEFSTLPPPSQLNLAPQPIQASANKSPQPLHPEVLAPKQPLNLPSREVYVQKQQAPPPSQKPARDPKGDPWMLVQMLEKRVRALEERLNSAEGRVSFLEGELRMRN